MTGFILSMQVNSGPGGMPVIYSCRTKDFFPHQVKSDNEQEMQKCKAKIVLQL